MLQASLKSLDSLEIRSSFTICNEEHRFFVAEQLREIDKLGVIILEPVGRNTAPEGEDDIVRFQDNYGRS
jgi:mannose-1-phosphate guanylyltransferase